MTILGTCFGPEKVTDTLNMSRHFFNLRQSKTKQAQSDKLSFQLTYIITKSTTRHLDCLVIF